MNNMRDFDRWGTPQGMTYPLYTYYSILRPIGPGTAPRGAVDIVNFNERRYVDEIGREAWGFLIYKEPLKNPEDWDLIKA